MFISIYEFDLAKVSLKIDKFRFYPKYRMTRSKSITYKGTSLHRDTSHIRSIFPFDNSMNCYYDQTSLTEIFVD